jgi:hypothetical protein
MSSKFNLINSSIIWFEISLLGAATLRHLGHTNLNNILSVNINNKTLITNTIIKYFFITNL